jgi:hypothetical protein
MASDAIPYKYGEFAFCFDFWAFACRERAVFEPLKIVRLNNSSEVCSGKA